MNLMTLRTLAITIFFAFPSLAVGQVEIETQLALIEDIALASVESGVVKKVLVKPGQRVSKDEVLFQLDDTLYGLKVKSTEVERQIAEIESKSDVNLRFAEKSFEVNKKIQQRSEQAAREVPKSVAAVDIDRLRLETEQSVLSKEKAEMEMKVGGLKAVLKKHETDTAMEQLDRRSIRSPLDGIVVEVDVDPGEATQAGVTVARVIDLKRLRAQVALDTSYYLRINKRTKAKFVPNSKYGLERGASVSYPATITFIKPIFERDDTFQVWLEIDNSGKRLRPGMNGTIKFDVN